MLTVVMARMLKGAPLKCLVALLLAHKQRLGPQGRNGSSARAAGVREPARLEHVSVDLIEYHAQSASAGQAIYRIEHNWPARSADGGAQDRRRYAEGRFAEVVEH
jgi:hypothetical protein